MVGWTWRANYNSCRTSSIIPKQSIGTKRCIFTSLSLSLGHSSQSHKLVWDRWKGQQVVCVPIDQLKVYLPTDFLPSKINHSCGYIYLKHGWYGRCTTNITRVIFWSLTHWNIISSTWVHLPPILSADPGVELGVIMLCYVLPKPSDIRDITASRLKKSVTCNFICWAKMLGKKWTKNSDSQNDGEIHGDLPMVGSVKKIHRKKQIQVNKESLSRKDLLGFLT